MCSRGKQIVGMPLDHFEQCGLKVNIYKLGVGGCNFVFNFRAEVDEPK